MSQVLSYPEILERIDAVDPLAYRKTRNHITGAVSRLSPYITRGVVTLPHIRERIYARYSPRQAETFIKQLAWREYFQAVWWACGEDIFNDLRFSRTDWHHRHLVSAVVAAQTGIDEIDHAITEWYASGTMHNHARLWVAALACNLVKSHWYPMSRWLYYHLADGDLASNTLSWQWVAGTLVNKRYDMNQALINACGRFEQRNTFLEINREDLHTLPVPAHLMDSEPAIFPTRLPPGDPVASVAGQRVMLYHPWHLSPTWRSTDSPQRRILVIEPSHFQRFPVSEAVMTFIVHQARALLPDIEVFVGDLNQLPGLTAAAAPVTRTYPAVHTWPVIHDPPERLFPAVTGYYPSFSKYWHQVNKPS